MAKKQSERKKPVITKTSPKPGVNEYFVTDGKKTMRFVTRLDSKARSRVIHRDDAPNAKTANMKGIPLETEILSKHFPNIYKQLIREANPDRALIEAFADLLVSNARSHLKAKPALDRGRGNAVIHRQERAKAWDEIIQSINADLLNPAKEKTQAMEQYEVSLAQQGKPIPIKWYQATREDRAAYIKWNLERRPEAPKYKPSTIIKKITNPR